MPKQPFSIADLNSECQPSALLHNLNVLGLNTPNHTWVVAYSGGVDSVVLVDMLASARADVLADIRVVHINHNLQDEAQGWQAHCQARCEQLSMAFEARVVDIEQASRTSLEATARQARYEALLSMADEYLNQRNEKDGVGVLLTAHHQSDQAETLLLQLLRGAGAKGLSAMPVIKSLSNRVLQARPLLACAKADVLAYAHNNKLSWIEDPSNQIIDFDRNYLRHEVLPVLRERFVQADATMARSAQLLASSQWAMTELMAYTGLDFDEEKLNISILKDMSPSLQAEVIRHWLAVHALLMPTMAIMDQILNLLNLPSDKQGEVSWGGSNSERACLSAYDGQLWLVDEFEPFDAEQVIAFNSKDGVGWSVGAQSYHLSAAALAELGINDDECELIFNQPNTTKVYLEGRVHSTSLKNVFQSMRVPPWLRMYCPLIRVDGIVKSVINIRNCA